MGCCHRIVAACVTGGQYQNIDTNFIFSHFHWAHIIAFHRIFSFHIISSHLISSPPHQVSHYVLSLDSSCAFVECSRIHAHDLPLFTTDRRLSQLINGMRPKWRTAASHHSAHPLFRCRALAGLAPPLILETQWLHFNAAHRLVCRPASAVPSATHIRLPRSLHRTRADGWRCAFACDRLRPPATARPPLPVCAPPLTR